MSKSAPTRDKCAIATHAQTEAVAVVPSPHRPGRIEAVPPEAYFVGSAIFHYLGPSFAVLLFARV